MGFGCWRKMVKKREVSGSHVFPSCGDNRESGEVGAIAATHLNDRVKMKRSGNFSTFTHPKCRVWVCFTFHYANNLVLQPN